MHSLVRQLFLVNNFIFFPVVLLFIFVLLSSHLMLRKHSMCGTVRGALALFTHKNHCDIQTEEEYYS